MAKEIIWNTVSLGVGRLSRSGVVLEKSGTRGSATQENDKIKTWKQFFSPEMLNIIMQHTNKHIRRARTLFPLHILTDSRYTYIQETYKSELLSFISLLYAHSLLCMNDYDLSCLYAPLIGSPVFGATLSQNRLKFLIACVTFNDKDFCKERWQNNRFTAVR